MDENTEILVSVERKVYAYAEMWHTSACLLERGKERERASLHQFRASLVFTAFTLEAYLNHIGAQLFNCWDDLERLRPKEKLNLAAEYLKVPINYGVRPWQVMKDLFGFRNEIAHGRSHVLKPPVKRTTIAKHEADLSMARTWWEDFCTAANADSARDDVEKMVMKLYEAAKAMGHDTGYPFIKGTQSGNVQIAPPRAGGKS